MIDDFDRIRVNMAVCYNTHLAQIDYSARVRMVSIAHTL